MKKILFLLLLTCAGYAQTSTGQEQEFDYGIKNNSTQTVINPNMLVTEGADGTYGKVSVNNVPISTAVRDSLNKKLNLPTGFLQGLQLSINADPTKYNIAAGYYVITDFTNLAQPVVKIITYPGATGITPTYLASANSTYVALDKNMNIISSASPFTDAQRRTLAIIGNVVHSNHTTINVTNEIKAPIVALGNQLHDFMKAIGFLNESGNIYSPNGANLQLNKSAGDIFGMGINSSDYLNPHKLTIAAQTALTFAYRFQNGTQLADTQNINPNIYDVGGVNTATPTNKWTIQRINLFQSGLARIQPGQTVYNSFIDATTALPTQPFVTEQNIADNAVFRCYLIVQQGTTNLASAVADGTAQFVPVDKFGNVIGNGSVALTYANIIAALGYTPANDADVIHKTGDETKTGKLTLSKSLSLTNVTPPATLPTVTINGAAGNLTGEYLYGVSYYTADGKDTGVPNITSVLTLSSGKVDISNIPISSNPLVIGRRIYRTAPALGDYRAMKLVTQIADNTTTTYQDNIPDDSLGAYPQWYNTTGGEVLLNGSRILSIDGQSFAIGRNVSPNNTGYANHIVGNYAGSSLTYGYRNTLNSLYAGYSLTTGYENTATGVHSINYNTTGKRNTAYGYGSLFKNTNGDDNVAIGNSSLSENLTGSKNIGLGNYAGYWELGSDKFYLNNIKQANTSDDISKSMLYGIFNANPASQYLRMNAKVGIGVAADSYYDLKVGGSSGTGIATQWSAAGGSYFKNSEMYFPFGAIFAFDVSGTKTTAFRYDSNGNFYFTKVPTTSAGTYDFITRNTSTGVVEKVTAIPQSLVTNLTTDLAAKASLASPTFTGTPTAPTATAGTNTTQIATTAFVTAATGNYKKYVAILNQVGTSSPTATVLENTLGGTVVWTRNNTGIYEGTLTAAFTDLKTFCLISLGGNGGTAYSGDNTFQINRNGASIIELRHTRNDVAGDDFKAAVEIRVYN